jgi:hypothetical protein
MAGDLFMKHAELKIIFPKNSEAAVRASGTNGHSVRIRLHIHAANNVPHAGISSSPFIWRKSCRNQSSI